MPALLDLPHHEARALLEAGAPAWLPINPVEYHGPHLSLHNDHVVSVGLIEALHPQVAPEHPLLMCADLEAGAEPCPGPGTRAVPYPRLRKLVLAACDALADLGARKVVLVTFHGAPLHAAALQAGVRRLTRRGVRAVAPFDLVMNEMLSARGEDYAAQLASIADDEDRATVTAELPTDFHAGFFETSLALHYAPGTVSPLHRRLPPCPAPAPVGPLLAASHAAARLGRPRLARELYFAAVGLGWAALRPFPGYTSHPALATAEVGRAFAAYLEPRAARLITDVFAGHAVSPAPIMGWLRWVSLGGRIGGLEVPLTATAPPPA